MDLALELVVAAGAAGAVVLSLVRGGHRVDLDAGDVDLAASIHSRLVRGGKRGPDTSDE